MLSVFLNNSRMFW